jgi:hypothetical protein
MVRIWVGAGGEDRIEYKEGKNVKAWEGFLCVVDKNDEVFVGFNVDSVDHFEIIEEVE